MLKHDIDNSRALLLVFVNDIDGLRRVGHRIVLIFRCILRHLDGREELFDFLHDFIGVNVAHDDDALKVWAVPLLIVVAQFLRFEVVNHFHRSDREAVGIARAWIERWQVAFEDAHCGRRA